MTWVSPPELNIATRPPAPSLTTTAGDRLPGREVHVGRRGLRADVRIEGEIALGRGLGDGDVHHHGGRPGGHASPTADLDGHRGPGPHRGGQGAGAVRVSSMRAGLSGT